MKFNILLSILFTIVTSFTAIHEVEHIVHDDSTTCLVCTVNHNLVSADAVTHATDIEIYHPEKISQNSPISYLHVKINSNQNRAPPLAS